MHKATFPRAVLPNLLGKGFPEHELNIAGQYQFCVDVGAMAASDFFGNMPDCALHDHIALAAHEFIRMAAKASLTPQELQASRTAFIAGYLGRIQQELRLFHAETERPAYSLAPSGKAANSFNSFH